MTGEYLGENLFRLRKSKGLSQDQLANEAGISRQAYVQIEKGKVEPKAKTLMNIANVLSITLQDLFAEPPEMATIRFRSNKRFSDKEKYIRNSMIYDVHKWLNEYNFLEKSLNLKNDFNLSVSNNEPIKAAVELREAMRIRETEPIIDILNFIENRNVKILLMQSDLKQFFGLSIGIEDGGPAIVVNTFSDISIERQIFTVAHELAHILLHKSSFIKDEMEEIIQEENEANQFASHFLLPDSAFKKEWHESRGLHFVDAVLHIKRKYRISYRVVLKRIVDDNISDNRIYAKFSIEYQKKYGKNLRNHYEPDALEDMVYKKDEPECLTQSDFLEDRLYSLVRLAYEKNIISIGKASEILKKSLNDMRELNNSWIAVG
jgi:Zn-dependent peptidase ImmA (M78 family)/DNA-binding XRE family transcriptional regulator